jgi:hypothetical protein
MAFPQRPKYYSNVAPSATQRDMDNFIDEQRNADMLDALADIAYMNKNKPCVNPSKANGMASMKSLMPNAMPVIITMNATSTPTVTHETIPISTT